jgi:hypothetical protein
MSLLNEDWKNLCVSWGIMGIPLHNQFEAKQKIVTEIVQSSLLDVLLGDLVRLVTRYVHRTWRDLQEGDLLEVADRGMNWWVGIVMDVSQKIHICLLVAGDSYSIWINPHEIEKRCRPLKWIHSCSEMRWRDFLIHP